MSHAGFVHLRVHTAFSLAEGALRVEEVADLCRSLAMPAVAMTDTNNLFGALQFSNKCAEQGVQPIIGVQLTVSHEHADMREAMSGPQRVSGALEHGSGPMVLLAQNEEGYQNLLKLMSEAYLEGDGSTPPHASLDHLLTLDTGLIALTGGPAGPVGHLLRDGQHEAAETLLKRLKESFGDRLYMELQRHNLAAEDRLETYFVDLAYAHDIPLVATNDVYFAGEDMFEAHDALLCIADSAYVSQRDRRRVTPDHRFKSADEMRALFADLPEAIDNTLVIAQRCAFMVERRDPMLPPFPLEEGSTEMEELRIQAEKGLEERLQAHVRTEAMDDAAFEKKAHTYRDRLSYELGVIEKMGYAGYFLIVADFIQWAKDNDIPVGPGRGSGAGSVVAWSLLITDLDPLRFSLLFERFLNPERVSMPDFDIDFCQDKRDQVIRYVQGRYGREKVAQIITFGKLQARAVVRDVGRVLEMPYGQVDRIAKLIPNNPAKPTTLAEALEVEPQLAQMRETDEAVSHLLDLALKLEGLYRNASTHAAGVVIGDRPLDEMIPLYRDPRSEMPVTQFNMKDVEQAGLVKFDFLGLKTLTVLSRAQALLDERDIKIDFSDLPLDDENTFAMLRRGETTGVFQMESSGVRDVLRSMQPDKFEDLIAVVALYRPGPMDNIPSYINRKHGDEEAEYLYPSLEPILKETYGIIVYQEQVMQIAQELAGFTLGSADILRRAMGKKEKAVMDQQREIFVAGAQERGVEGSKASEIFDLVAKFAEYGFNKSHAAAYALVAYQTAYLKANHPVEFMAASMTLDMHNTDKLNVFRQELDRTGVQLLPPDINLSMAEFSVEETDSGEQAIRYALGAIKNVGTSAMSLLTRERDANGPFSSLMDFAQRLDHRVINKRQLENLARAGAFTSLHPNRHQVFANVDTIVRVANTAANDRESHQIGLFGGKAVSEETIKLQEVEEWEPMDLLKEEFDAIGFYLSAHPLDAYKKVLKRLGVKFYHDVEREERPGLVKLAGTVIGKKERRAKNGSKYAFITLSDVSGVFEVMVFSETLFAAQDLLEEGNSVLLRAEAQIREGMLKLVATRFESLDEAARHAPAGMRIVVGAPDTVEAVHKVLAGCAVSQSGGGDRAETGAENGGGSGNGNGNGNARGNGNGGGNGNGNGNGNGSHAGTVSLVAKLGFQQEVEVSLPGRYDISPRLIQRIGTLDGVLLAEEM